MDWRTPQAPTLEEERSRLKVPPRVECLVLERTSAHKEPFNPIKQGVCSAGSGALHSLEHSEEFRVVLT